MRCRIIYHDIMNILLDYKRHTVDYIANEIGVCNKTVRNHITELSLYFPIQTYSGGRNSGGVQLDKTFVINNRLVSNMELNVIYDALSSFQKVHTNNVIVSNLIVKLFNNTSV